MRLYYWIHHTGEYERNTGVQRVCRNLASTLSATGHELIPVRWCAEREAIIRAEERWTTGLARFGGPEIAVQPEEGVPVHLTAADAGRLDTAWLLLAEVPHVAGEVAPNLAVALDYARFHGLRSAAVFYDLIPLRQPGYEGMADAHELYARTLVAADLVLAISVHSANDLRRWWTEHHYDCARLPTVLALPLPEEMRGHARTTQPDEPPTPPIRFVALGTIEPRKNQLKTMRAFVRLCVRRPDLDLRLELVGGIHEAVKDEVEELVAQENRMRLHGYVSDAEVVRLVSASQATVFTSLDEGFGLPIAESLWQGKPCLCSDHGSMAEIAAGGGCLTVSATDEAAIERGLERLAEDSSLRRRLAEEACDRKLGSWHDYGEKVAKALAATTVLQQVIVIEGSRGGGMSADALLRAGASVRRLRWRADSGALLPGDAELQRALAPGSGQLDGLWAILPLATCGDAVEAHDIIAAAHGLGLRVALEAHPEVIPTLLTEADTTLFSDAAAREAALTAALRDLPRTVALRAKLQVGQGAAALATLSTGRARIASAGAPKRPKRIYYWVGLTAKQPFNTGIQRVTRLLGAALQRRGIEVVPVGWDAAVGNISPISEEGVANLARWNGPQPLPPRPLPADLAGEWLLLPEITVPVVPPGSDVGQLAHSLGMRCAAVFYDLIPEKMPEIYPPGAVDNMRAFWRTFNSVDLAMPISWTAAADLRRYLASEGMRQPAIVPCPLAGDASGETRTRTHRADRGQDQPLHLLAVGTWEPRKNYSRLLRAMAAAQARSRSRITLTLVGRRAGYASLDSELEALAATAEVKLLDEVEDVDLFRRYAEADATVFASWEEGFGLPILESLWHGSPCLCHAGSAMAELVPGGGVLAVDMLDEVAITEGLVRLADEPGLLARLRQEAVTRPIRTWDEYAEDVLRALSCDGSAPGWPLPAIARRRPLLTCAITTYNRAPWLKHSLSRLLEVTRPWRDVVEVVVCDNASSDHTSDVVAQFRSERNFGAHRNRANLGMLGNLGTTAQASRGAFVWLLGDDDLVVDGAIENLLEGLATHPDVEMAYMNYAYTHFDNPSQLVNADEVIANATAIARAGPNRRVAELRDVAALNENLFTAIYTCAFRRDHALRAYQLDTRGTPFTSLRTCIPSAVYALAALQDRPAWWVGEPAVVVNMHVSWLRWALLWHLERRPELFEEAERCGVDPERLDRYRLQHLVEAETWVRATYFEAEDSIRKNFSLARLLERCKHLPEFREHHLPGIVRVYSEAWAAGRVVVDPIEPDELFARYGLSTG
jgi:glycosyltransferase involved in cell wall biosynthesis